MQEVIFVSESMALYWPPLVGFVLLFGLLLYHFRERKKKKK